MTWDEKARRRLAKEDGTIFKDWGGRIPIALTYPNTYYVGMSNLGFQTIYGLLNSYDNIVCERVFWDERSQKSLESQRPLSDFAGLAFSISYELDYFNVVEILKSSGIPLFAADRNQFHPLVIAGGPCMIANPEPLAPFFDCLAIGEGEAILPPMLEVLAEGIGGRREELLRELASVPGVYVPRLYNGKPISRQWVREIDDFATTSVILTPETEFGDMYLIEIARGCPWGCRFCLAGFLFRPFRHRSLDSLLGQAEIGLKFEKRIGLLGAAVSDHPDLDELVTGLRRMGAQLSVSSLRICPLSEAVLKALAESGAQTVTLAPEAGSERLRRIINKGVAERDIVEAIDKVAGHGFRQLKLYFMIGLPTETDDDVDEIVKLALALKGRIDRRQTGCQITLTVEPFVPKAGTPFQWLPMTNAEILSHRLALLKNSLKPKGIEIKSESVGWMVIQGVLARGDARLAQALARMEGKSLSSWRRALEECGLDADFYVNREIPPTERLPWSILDSGVDLGYLELELEKAFHGEETVPCPPVGCQECGVC
ncbi:MAG: radical SAM protein [Dehalococcoidia bacterium]|nr:MAG: radical SAM protein [Dehalococcoidia bacterium]